MNYIITGGTGFIGSYLIKQLLNQGDRVITYDLIPDENSIQMVLSSEEIKMVENVIGDVADLCHFMKTLKKYGIEKIVHLASLQIPASNENPPLAIRTNCIGFTNILEAAYCFNIKRVVWASSIAVYGSPEFHPDGKVDDNSSHHPTSVYAATKSLNEYIANHYFYNLHVDSIGVRFSSVYGVGRLRGASKFATELLENTALGKPAVVPYGDDVINWQYVDDAARALKIASEVDSTKTRIFNTVGELKSMREAASYVKQLIPQADIKLLPGKFGLVWEYDTYSTEHELGYYPQYSMEEGIRNTLSGFMKLYKKTEVFEGSH